MQLLHEKQHALINALKSGEYQKNMGGLGVVENGVCYYCCLGVAEIVVGDNWQWRNETLAAFHSNGKYHDHETLSYNTAQALNLYSNVGEFVQDPPEEALNFLERNRTYHGVDAGPVSNAKSLIDLNDTLELPLTKIGEFIERWPEVVFTNQD